LHGSAQGIEHGQQCSEGEPELVLWVGSHRRRPGVAARQLLRLGHERPEANQQGLRRCPRRGQPGPVAVQHCQVQVSLTGSLGPLANRRPGYVVRLGHMRHQSALPQLGNRAEDVGDIVGLSRQNVAGKDALARLAGIAAA
jgi:hypothetical protein